VQVAHGDFVKSRPDLIERYFRGLQKALDLIRSDPQAAKNAAFAFLADQAATSSAYPDAIRDAAWKNTLPYFPDTVALDRKKLSAARAFFDISDKAPDSVLVDNSIALKLAAARPAIVSAK
jgi:ABC-type nitrate/sulfonate/bicarbonate transport system substrate-binding protein